METFVYDKPFDISQRLRLDPIITDRAKTNLVNRIRPSQHDMIILRVTARGKRFTVRESLNPLSEFLEESEIDAIASAIDRSVLFRSVWNPWKDSTGELAKIAQHLSAIKARCGFIIRKLKHELGPTPADQLDFMDSLYGVNGSNDEVALLILGIQLNKMILTPGSVESKVAAFLALEPITNEDIERYMSQRVGLLIASNLLDQPIRVCCDNVVALDLLLNAKQLVFETQSAVSDLKRLARLIYSQFVSSLGMYLEDDLKSDHLSNMSRAITNAHLLVINHQAFVDEADRLSVMKLLCPHDEILTYPTSGHVDPGLEDLAGPLSHHSLIGRFLFINVAINRDREGKVDDVTTSCQTYPDDSTSICLDARSLFGTQFEVDIRRVNSSGLGTLITGLLAVFPEALIGFGGRVLLRESFVSSFIRDLSNDTRIADTVITVQRPTVLKMHIGTGSSFSVRGLSIKGERQGVGSYPVRISMLPPSLQFTIPDNYLINQGELQANAMATLCLNLGREIESRLSIFNHGGLRVKVAHSATYPGTFTLTWATKE